MDSLVGNHGNKTSDVPIKALEIQATTHVDIIAIGNEVFQKNSDIQIEQFNAKLQQHEINLIKRLEEEKQAALDDLRIQHEINIENLKQQYTLLMDNALKEEAVRLKDIMNKIGTTLLEEEKLDGQRHLDESIKKAREDFDTEKEEALIQHTLEHEARQKEIERQTEEAHKLNIEKLIMKWKKKMEVQAEKSILHESETLDNEIELATQRFDIRLKEALSEADRNHKGEMNKLNQSISNEKLNGIHLKNTIQSLATSIDDMKVDLKKVLGAFQRFVDQSPGFSPGQSEYVLDNLLPDGFDEFVSSSD